MTLVSIPQSTKICKNLVGGEWILPQDTPLKDVVSPYTGEIIGQVPFSRAQDVDSVVREADAAFPEWRKTPIKERSQILFRFREIVLKDIAHLSNIAALEAGKSVEEARAGIMKGLEVVEFALSLQNSSHGGAMEVSRGVWCHSQREPLGVVAGIAPFNFPAMVPLWMYPIALVLGNCFVLKPSEKVPLTSSFMAEHLLVAGLPKGVMSIVNGGEEAVRALATHSQVKALGFVGSSPVAKSVYSLATSFGKRALCLGGAKNSIIITPDADIALAARGVVDSFTGCAGQRCMAASLLIGVGNIEPILQEIVKVAAMRSPGNGVGAIIDSRSHQRIKKAIEDAKREGATLLLDGRSARSPEGFEKGNWLGPTIIDNARPEMACATMEIFGPVLTVLRVNNLSEAMAIEARSPYGNATSVFTTNGSVARFVSDHATTGMVGINIGVPVPREPFSFGGTKDSKFGQGDITGMSSLDLWSNLKKITTKWTEQADANWMS